MKISKLHLMSYGPFTDHELDLSQTNFNLIYGPNEAGKSSSLRAIMALLYGIPSKTGDDFIHRYADLRVGATLINTEGHQLSFARRKRNKGSLVTLDESEKVLADNVLDEFLRGTEKQRFNDIHCINHEQFRAGGRLMLELHGLADDSLLAASTSANFPSLQNELRDQVTDLYASRKSTSKLLKAKKEYDEIRKDKKRYEVHVRQWQQLEEQKYQLEQDRTALDRQRTAIRVEEKKLERILLALPKISEWKRRNEALRGKAFTALPATYSVEARRECEKQLELIGSTLSLHEQRLADLQAELQETEESPQLIAKTDEIEHLQQRIGMQKSHAEERDASQHELELIQRNVARLLGDMGAAADFEQVEKWRLSREQRSTIRQLATEEKELRERTRRLDSSIAEVKRAIQRLEEQQQGAEHGKDIGSLQAEIVMAKRREGLEDEIQRQQTELEVLESRAERNVQGLPFWHRSLDELARAKVPLHETISDFADRFVRMSEQVERSSQALEKHFAELSELQKLTAAAKRTTSIVTEEDLGLAREQRDYGWQLIRRAWRDGEPIDAAIEEYAGSMSLEKAYESHVTESDSVSDRLRREADRVAMLAQQEEQARMLKKKSDSLRKEHEAALHSQADLQAEWIQLWRDGGMAEARTPREMAKWLELRAELLSQANEIADLRRQLAEQQTRHDATCEQLRNCLRDYDVLSDSQSLGRLLDLAETHRDQLLALHGEREQSEQELVRLGGELEDLTDQAEVASSELQQWQKGWSTAMQWIHCQVDTTATQAMARLESIEELLDQYDQWQNRTGQMAAAEAAANRFAEDVSGLCESVDVNVEGESPIQMAQLLKKSLDEAQKQHQAAERIRGEIKKIEDEIADQSNHKRELVHKLGRFLSAAGVDSQEELLEVEAFSELSHQCDALEEEIRAIAGSLEFQEFLRQTAGKDEAELEAQIEQLDNELEELEQKRDDVTSKINETEAQMAEIDGNDAYAKADQLAMNRLSSIHDIAGRFAVLKIAESILRQQVERYREENKDPLLERASEYFAAMTCHEFLGLRVDYDQHTGKPIIVGIRSENRKPMEVSAMSDGTRDPMFLSLRLAYLEHRLNTYEPMPFIVDDILIHLDDQRALATLRVLTELSEQMQVLFFTHHDRLRDLAETHLPADQIIVHELAKAALV